MVFETKIFFSFAIRFKIENARVAELVDALDSKSSSFGSVGSIPTQGTDKAQKGANSSKLKKELAFFLSDAQCLLLCFSK